MSNMDLNSEKEEGCASITPFRIKSQIRHLFGSRHGTMAEKPMAIGILFVQVCLIARKEPMALRKFVCLSLPNCKKRTPMARRKFVCTCLVIMTLGDLDKQGDKAPQVFLTEVV